MRSERTVASVAVVQAKARPSAERAYRSPIVEMTGRYDAAALFGRLLRRDRAYS